MKRAVGFLGVNQVGLIELDLPELLAGEVLLRTDVSAVSPGTELRCLAGLQPNSVPFPFVSGYAMVGVVEAVGPEVDLPLGTRVFASGTQKAAQNLQWGGHVSHAVTSATSTYILPEGCAPSLASLAKMVAIASRGVTVSGPKPGEKVAVVGLGLIGLLSARLFALAGADVLGVETAPDRLTIPSAAGLPTSLLKGSISETVQAHFGRSADIVVDATGNASVLPHSMKALRDLGWGDVQGAGPKLVIQGSYPGDFSLPYQESFVKELTILVPRDTRPPDIRRAIELIASEQLKVDDLITWIGSPEHAAQAYKLLQTDRTKLTAVFDWAATS